MKREVASTIVEKGVNERIRLTQIYEKKKEELLRQHQEVQTQLEEERTKVRQTVLIMLYFPLVFYIVSFYTKRSLVINLTKVFLFHCLY